MTFNKITKFFLILLTFSLFYAVLNSCSGNDNTEAENLAAGKREEVYGTSDISAKGSLSENFPSEAINFGITPWDNPDKLRKMYAPFITYLSEGLNKRVRFLVSQEYQDLVSDLKNGIIHIAAFSPGAYADALDSGIEKDAIYVASTQNEGKNYYHGVIITRKEFKDLKSLKGKSFAFVEKGSSSGYKFPLAMFLQKGLDPYKHFSKVFYLGSHPNVLDAVLNNKADAGATWDGFYEKNISAENNVHIIMKTDLIPFDAIVVSRKKGKDLVSRLQSLLVKINKDTLNSKGEKILPKELGFPYTGYVIHSDKIYDVVRKTGKLIRNYKPPTEKNADK